jgi:ring-1,2-phenylacetyl-CoA epoxidase subunit PaaE
MTSVSLASSSTEFHPATVTAVAPAAADGSAVAVRLRIPDDLRRLFEFAAGQYVTIRATIAGSRISRIYSLCGTPAELVREGILRIGVRVLPGGVFSGYARDGLAIGNRLDIAPPRGRFTTVFDPGRRRHYAAVVAGSGITPALSLISTALATEPASRCTVLFGNRQASSAMFLEELADLKDRYPCRLQVGHVFSRERRQIGLAGGRLDRRTLPGILDALVDPTTVDEWFVCGPYEMVHDVHDVLTDHGVDATAVHVELFHPNATGPRPDDSNGNGRGEATCALTVVLDGRSTTAQVPPGQPILDSALSMRPELPFSCRTGVCATCRARVVSGQVDMARTWMHTAAELAAGYVLTCQSMPVSAEVTVDYDTI